VLHSDTEAFADCSGTACHNDVDDEARCGRRDRKCRCRVLQGRSGSASHRMIGPRSKSAEARKTSVNRSRCLDATNDRQRHRGQQFRDLQALSGLGARVVRRQSTAFARRGLGVRFPSSPPSSDLHTRSSEGSLGAKLRPGSLTARGPVVPYFADSWGTWRARDLGPLACRHCIYVFPNSKGEPIKRNAINLRILVPVL